MSMYVRADVVRVGSVVSLSRDDRRIVLEHGAALCEVGMLLRDRYGCTAWKSFAPSQPVMVTHVLDDEGQHVPCRA